MYCRKCIWFVTICEKKVYYLNILLKFYINRNNNKDKRNLEYSLPLSSFCNEIFIAELFWAELKRRRVILMPCFPVFL